MPDLTQLGFGLGALALIWVVVRYFIDTVNRKDTQISIMIGSFNRRVISFNKTINNHIVHETEQSKRETEVLSKLDKSIKLLTTKIDKK